MYETASISAFNISKKRVIRDLLRYLITESISIHFIKQSVLMNKNKTLAGTIGIVIGYILFVLLVDAVSKPSNISLALRPIDSIKTYFFSFVFTLGTIGWVIGGVLLIGFLVLFYLIGVETYKTLSKK